MRTTANLFIYLDVAAMLAGLSSLLASCNIRSSAHIHTITDSIKIYTSTNNVLLTSGVDGVLPPKYFKQVMHKVKGGELEELPLQSTEA
jgi:2'-phosphotransferase